MTSIGRWLNGKFTPSPPTSTTPPKCRRYGPPPSHTYTATPNAYFMKTASFTLPGLGATGYRLLFTADAVSNLTATSVLAVSLANPRGDMGLSVMSAQIAADPHGTVAVEDYGLTPATLRRRVLDLKSTLPPPPHERAPWRSFIAIASCTDTARPDAPHAATLKMAIADRLDTVVLPQFKHGVFWYNSENVGFPEYTCNARLEIGRAHV